jgi:TatD DNase family protein
MGLAATLHLDLDVLAPQLWLNSLQALQLEF